MRLHCLGTAGYHPNESRHTSCYFLPEAGVILDGGTGVFRLAPLIETDELDLLLSHAHLDHTCGLTFLLDVLYQRPVKKLRIWGEAAKLDAIRAHLFSSLIFPVELEALWYAIDGKQEFEAGGATVTWRHQEHPGGSVAYRLDWGASEGRDAKRLLYVTDTTGDTSNEAIEWYQGADLMMHECYFEDSMAEWAQKTGHTWTSKLVEIAGRSSPKQLLVTHVNPLTGCTQLVGGGAVPKDFQGQCDIIAKQACVPVALASDEMVLDF